MNNNIKKFLTSTQGTGLELNSEVVKMYSTREVCESIGVTRRALGLYVKKGLIENPKKVGDGESNKYNYYDFNSLVRLIIIKSLSNLKIPLKDIKTILENGKYDIVLGKHLDSMINERNELNRVIDRIVQIQIDSVDSMQNRSEIKFNNVDEYHCFELELLNERMKNIKVYDEQYSLQVISKLKERRIVYEQK